MTDFDLIRLYLEKQDEMVLRTLLERYLQLGFAIIYRIVGDKEEAEDILQEALIKVVNGLKTFKMESSFKTWFGKICYHEGINQYKRRKPLVSLEDVAYELHDSHRVDDEVETEMEKEVIWSCVEELDPKYRTVLLSFYQNELSIKEIAEMMNTNENTIKTHLSRAKSQLKQQLATRSISSL